MDDVQNIGFGECAVVEAELLNGMEVGGEALNGLVVAGDLDLVATSHDTHLRMLVAQARYIAVVDAVEDGGIK